MKSSRYRGLIWGGVGALALGLGCSPVAEPEQTAQTDTAEDSLSIRNPAGGQVQVYQTNFRGGAGNIDRNNAFFHSFGTNGRTCNSCHKLENALGISAENIRRIFDQTQGLDPIFRTNDGSNAPTGVFANTSTVAARRRSFSMLLDHGVIRIGLGMPARADFRLSAVRDPYSFASQDELSLFRRPLPAANVAFNTLSLWDGRESEGRPANRDALLHLANEATVGHAQARVPLTAQQRAEIADFQLNLFSAQITSDLVGRLDVVGCTTDQTTGEPCERARGGAVNLAAVLTRNPGGVGGTRFFPGINDPFAPGFDNISLTIYDPWESDVFPATDKTELTRNRGDIGDGANLFYTKPITITNVPGLNDVLGQPSISGFCTTCHNTPDVGNHSRPRFMNTGTADVDGNPMFGSEYPVYEFTQNNRAGGGSGAVRRVTDPGVGLRTGRFSDIGKFKVPNLRGLGARAPYFHNGEARDLTDVVRFYNQRFNIGFTAEEIRKVVLFLQQT